ncbi:MAG: hypothetical protein Q9183_003944 [Haloplaca sp. 2 TL-2023]
MSGITIRQALTLGLNLENRDPKLPDSSKEIRYRVWWAIAATERTLAVRTGRPTSFNFTDCSAPLPVPLEEESFIDESESYDTPAVQRLRRFSTGESLSTNTSMSSSSLAQPGTVPPLALTSSTPGKATGLAEGLSVQPNNGMFFLYSAKLSVLIDEVLTHLYRPTVMDHSWASVQGMILQFQKKLERWRSALPAIFDFTTKEGESQFVRQRIGLGLSYYSAVIIINRPCLCKIDQKIPDETQRGRDIDRASAASCVLAARELVGLLPDGADVNEIYRVTLWWSLVHHLMQAVAVLMIEMSFRASHCPDMTDDLLQASEKAVGWLQSMSADDMAAARAWRLSSELLRKLAPRIGRRIDDRLRWPMQVDDDMSMHNLFLASSRDYPVASTSDIYGGYEPITTWEPLIFTSYDDRSVGGDPSMVHLQGHGSYGMHLDGPYQRDEGRRQR